MLKTKIASRSRESLKYKKGWRGRVELSVPIEGERGAYIFHHYGGVVRGRGVQRETPDQKKNCWRKGSACRVHAICLKKKRKNPMSYHHHVSKKKGGYNDDDRLGVAR